MRLQEYLTEDTSLDSIMPLIKRDCSKWLKESGNRVVYRGMKGKPDFFTGTVRKDRTPKDTPEDVSAVTDEVFQEKFGWKPRSQGLFMTGSYYDTQKYGTTYIVFPIGDYRYVYSKNIADMFIDATRKLNSSVFDELISLFMKDGWLTKKIMKDNILKSMKTYSDTGLEEAIKGKVEIMVDCQSYYALSMKQYGYAELSKHFKV